MKTVYCTATSLNGFIADENNSLDWLMQFSPTSDSFTRFMDTVGSIAMGSTTYQWLLDNHVYSAKGENPWPYAIPSFVFTTRKLREIPNANIQFVKGDVAPVHKQLTEAANGKNIWIAGGGELAGKFHDQNLLDEIHLHLTSITLLGGAPVMPRLIGRPMELLKVEKMGANMVEVHYKINR